MTRHERWNWCPADVARKAATEYVVDSNGCHITTSPVNDSGYGVIDWVDLDGRARHMSVARAAYTHFFRHPTPDETVDHIHGLCSDTRCVRRDHLRLLSRSDNCARGRAGRDWLVGECPRGHVLDQGHPCSMCRAEVEVWRLRGWTMSRIAQETGYSSSTVYRLMTPARIRPRKDIGYVIDDMPAQESRELLIAPVEIRAMNVKRAAGFYSAV